MGTYENGRGIGRSVLGWLIVGLVVLMSLKLALFLAGPVLRIGFVLVTVVGPILLLGWLVVWALRRFAGSGGGA